MYTIGLRGVRAHRARLQVASHNMANADTEGYSRQSVRLSPALARVDYGRAMGMGVDASGPRRQEDASIQRTLRQTGERSGFFRGSARLLSHAEAIVDSDAGHPVANAVNTFFRHVGEATIDATSIPNRQSVLDAADRLAISIRDSYAGIERIRGQADNHAADVVNEINNLTSAIANLNQQIEGSENLSQHSGDLRDERDRALISLSELMNINVLDGDNGMVNVQTDEGYLLVGGINPHALGTQINITNNGHLDITSSSRPGNALVPAASIGGFLGGILAARDGALARQLTDLDDLAFDFANTVNTTLAAGTDLNGTTPGTALFTVSATRPGAGRTIDLNAAIRNQADLLAFSSTGAVADNTIALNLGRVEEQGIIGTALERPADAVSNSLYDLADAARDANDKAAESEIIFSEAKTIRDEFLGVSIDEELVKLTQAQRAFQGAAKVITTADEIMQEIMRLKR
jgi:flagellar hook-associated protein 1 FlgK